MTQPVKKKKKKNIKDCIDTKVIIYCFENPVVHSFLIQFSLHL